jgi:acetolactate synthase I/II/III large subunit
MKLSDYIIEFLVQNDVHHIFEVIGGAITHLLDSASNRKDIQCVSVHHEQTGAFAAEAYARMNGKLGVAMATSGPGALNLLTGIGSCYFDSVPCLFITGQVNTYEYKFDKEVRQIGFQETDIVSIAKPLTKYAEMVVEAQKIRYHLEKAVFIAQNGRPGPVLLDVPMNIQRAQIDPKNLLSFFDTDEYRQILQTAPLQERIIQGVIDSIRVAKRPVFLAGGGVRTSGAVADFQDVVRTTGIPVVTSLMGLDSLSHDHPAFFGMIGSYGNRYSNLTIANADLVLIMGSRLDTRQTGTRPDTFARAAKKIHVDVDPLELNTKIHVDTAVQADLKVFLKALKKALANFQKADLTAWYATINGFRTRYPTVFPSPTTDVINPNLFMELLSQRSGEGDIICLDVGQNQMWAAQSFVLKNKQRMITSGGMGSMGFALPAALGATKSSDRRTIVISGDGGIQMNIQDLDTIVNHRLPVKIFVMNNGCLGMVRQMQDMYFEGRQQSTVIGYSCPNLTKIAEAYGIPSHTIASMDHAEGIIDKALTGEGPAFVEVKLSQDTLVNPKLVVNRPIEDMSPRLDRKELHDIMLIDLAEEKDFEK